MSDRYVLNKNGDPEPCEDLVEWARQFEKGNRKLARETTGNGDVSTVFLGLDHSFGGSTPILFETMVFGGPLDGEQERYSTKAEAMAGHLAMVAHVKTAKP
jgi:hypothetical protein